MGSNAIDEIPHGDMKTLALLSLALLLGSGPARADDNLISAARALGMTTFVNEYCPGLSPNMAMQMGMLKQLGVSAEDLLKPEPRRVALAAYTQLSSSPESNCTLIKGMFGPEGTKFPGVFDAR